MAALSGMSISKLLDVTVNVPRLVTKLLQCEIIINFVFRGFSRNVFGLMLGSFFQDSYFRWRRRNVFICRQMLQRTSLPDPVVVLFQIWISFSNWNNESIVHVKCVFVLIEKFSKVLDEFSYIQKKHFLSQININ